MFGFSLQCGVLRSLMLNKNTVSMMTIALMANVDENSGKWQRLSDWGIIYFLLLLLVIFHRKHRYEFIN